MYLTDDHQLAYQRDGYVLLPDVFNANEVALMIQDVEGGGGRVAAHTRGNEDTTGKKARLAIWHELGDDIWASASTHPGVVNSARILLGEEVAFFHGKVMLKEAGTGGAWEWHQDYGYWYNQGFAFPRMLSAFVALDKATVENGCLQVLRGSHRLGRLDHGKVGNQTGADPARIKQIEQLFEREYVQMEPGSVLFFHSNLLHMSGPNESTAHRRSFIMCYNALANPQFGEFSNGTNKAEQRPCPVGMAGEIERKF
jgi:hypothetical protein